MFLVVVAVDFYLSPAFSLLTTGIKGSFFQVGNDPFSRQVLKASLQRQEKCLDKDPVILCPHF